MLGRSDPLQDFPPRNAGRVLTHFRVKLVPGQRAIDKNISAAASVNSVASQTQAADGD